MAFRKTGFGDDSATAGVDLTQGYRDRNPYFDADFVKEQIAPYKDAGLTQKLGDLRGMSDKQLYDMAAQSVIKLAKTNGVIGSGTGNGGGAGTGNGNGTGTGNGTGNGGTPKPPKKPKKPRKPTVPRKPKKKKPVVPKKGKTITVPDYSGKPLPDLNY